MAYRLVYTAQVQWVPPGMGPGLSNPVGPGVNGGPAQTLAFFNSETGVYPPNSTTFLSSDVTNLTNSMAADLAAQMSVAATLLRVQNFSTGTG
jgi:hypothetical protein